MELDLFALHINGLDLEIDPNGGNEFRIRIRLSLGELKQ
jgi:hypothetical protein